MVGPVELLIVSALSVAGPSAGVVGQTPEHVTRAESGMPPGLPPSERPDDWLLAFVEQIEGPSRYWWSRHRDLVGQRYAAGVGSQQLPNAGRRDGRIIEETSRSGVAGGGIATMLSAAIVRC